MAVEDDIRQLQQNLATLNQAFSQIGANVASVMSQVSAATKAATTSATAHAKAAQGQATSLTGVATAAGAAGTALNQANVATGAGTRSLREHRRELNFAKQVYLSKAKNVNMLTRNVRNFNEILRDSGRVSLVTNKSYDAMKNGVTDFNQGLSAMQRQALKLDYIKKQASGIAQEFTRIGKNTQWLGRNMMIGVSLPVITGASKALHEFLRFSKEMTRMKKVYGSAPGMFEEDREQLRALINDIGHAKALNRGLVAAIAADWAAAGYTLEHGLIAPMEGAQNGVVNIVTQMATLGDIDVSVASDQFRSLFSVFALGNNNLKTLNDQMEYTKDIFYQFNAIENSTSLQMRDLAEAFPEVAAQAKRFNLSGAQTAAILAGMYQKGIDVNEAATALKFVFSRIQTPTEKAKEVMARLGIVTKDTNGNFLTGIDILSQFAGKINSLAAADVAELFGETFGRRQENRMTLGLNTIVEGFEEVKQKGTANADAIRNDFIRALISAGELNTEILSKGNQALDHLRATNAAFIDQLQESAKAEEKAVLESPEKRWERMIQDAKQLLLELGEQILPVAQRVADNLTSIFKAFMEMPGAARAAILGLIGALATIGPIAFVWGQLAEAIGAVGQVALKILPVGRNIKFVTDEMINLAGGPAAYLERHFKNMPAKIGRFGNAYYILTGKLAGHNIVAEAAVTIEQQQLASTGALTAAIEAQTAAIMRNNAAQAAGAATGFFGDYDDVSDISSMRKAVRDKMFPGGAAISNVQREAIDHELANVLTPGAFGSRARKTGLTGTVGGADILGEMNNLGPRRSRMSRFATGSKGVAKGLGGMFLAPFKGFGSIVLKPLTVMFGLVGKFAKLGGKMKFTEIFSALGKILPRIIPTATKVLTSLGKFSAIGAIITGVVLFIKGLIKNWEKVKEKMEPGINALKEAFSRIGKAVGSVIKALTDGFKKFSGGSGDAAENSKSLWENVGTAISTVATVVSHAVNAISWILENILVPVFGWVGEVVGRFVGIFVDLFTGDAVGALKQFLGFFIRLASPIVDVVEFIIDAILKIPEVLASIVDKLGGWFDKLPGKVQTALKFNPATGVLAWGAELSSSIGGVIEGGIKKFRGTDLNQWIESQLRKVNLLPEPSVRKGKDDAEEAGKEIADAIAQGAADELGPGGAAESELSDAFKEFLSSFKSAIDDQVDKVLESAKEAYDDYSESVIQGYEDQIEAIQASQKQREIATSEAEYQAKRMELLRKKALDAENYLRERALAIYEGRIDDARMLDNEHVRNTADANEELSDLDNDHAEELTRRDEQAKMDEINRQKDHAKEMLDEKKKQLNADLDLLKQHTPRTAAEMQNLINTVAQKMTQYGATWQWGGQTAAALFHNAVGVAKKQLEEDAFWQGKNTAAAYLAGLAGLPAYAPIEGGTGTSAVPELPSITTSTVVPKEVSVPVKGGGSKILHDGGPVGGGIPQDVAATLQTGEYVINRRAAKLLGLNQLEKLNKAGDGIGDATKRINDATSFLFMGHLQNQIKAFTSGSGTIGGRKLEEFGLVGGGAIGGIQSLAKMLVDMFGVRISSMFRPGAITRSGNVSLHALGRAVDLAGTRSQMKAVFDYILQNTSRLGIQELIFEHLIWNKSGGLHNWPFNDHFDHVHVGIQELAAAASGTISQWVTLLKNVGFSGEGLRMAHAIMMAESGGNPLAQNVNRDGSLDRGLFQINSRWHPEVTDPFNPLANVLAAYRISNGGTAWNQWSTFKNGAYKKFYNASLMMKGGIVPFDNFPALLHAREMVLPAKVTEKVLNNTGGGEQKVTIFVENFIGQRAWFEKLMKEYNISTGSASDRAKGIQTRKITNYKDNVIRYRS